MSAFVLTIALFILLSYLLLLGQLVLQFRYHEYLSCSIIYNTADLSAILQPKSTVRYIKMIAFGNLPKMWDSQWLTSRLQLNVKRHHEGRFSAIQSALAIHAILGLFVSPLVPMVYGRVRI